ncbi:hypothetical protein BLN97_36400 [Bradyrhizobium elkanii]|nr:hypothetical protein BLN97_36400 [Bradyrhizobium elkanii]
MDADGQSAALASPMSLEASGDRFRFIHDALGGIEEFLPFKGRSRAGVSALEESAAQLVFEIAQATTKSRLLDSERFCRLAEASVVRCGDCPA